MRIIVNKILSNPGNGCFIQVYYLLLENIPVSMKNSMILLSCILRNASHIYACIHPKPKIYGYHRNVHFSIFRGRNVYGRNVQAETSVAKMSVAEMSEHL